MKKNLLPILLILLITSCDFSFENEQIPRTLIWVQVASAERQCIPPDYTSLEDAVNQLLENNISVFDSKTNTMGVCEACSCPTGITYLAQIDTRFLSKTVDLGWQSLDEGDDTPD